MTPNYARETLVMDFGEWFIRRDYADVGFYVLEHIRCGRRKYPKEIPGIARDPCTCKPPEKIWCIFRLLAS